MFTELRILLGMYGGCYHLSDYLPGEPGERPKGPRQRGGVAGQSGGSHVHVSAPPVQSRHRGLSGETENSVGGRRPPFSGNRLLSVSASASYSAERKPTLKEGVSLQVILTVSQIMWCRDLTECLEKEEGNHLEALEDFEKVNFEVRLRAGQYQTYRWARWSQWLLWAWLIQVHYLGNCKALLLRIKQ